MLLVFVSQCVGGCLECVIPRRHLPGYGSLRTDFEDMCDSGPELCIDAQSAVQGITRSRCKSECEFLQGE